LCRKPNDPKEWGRNDYKRICTPNRTSNKYLDKVVMSVNKISKKEYWKRKWLSKYRLVVMDDSTFEEKTSFKLSRMNIFVFGSLFAFILITLTTVFIIYSPLRQYILGYTAVENKRETLGLLFKVDSLQQEIENNEKYLASIKKVLVGNIKPQHDKDTVSFNISNPQNDPKAYRVTPNAQDSILRAEVAEEEKK